MILLYGTIYMSFLERRQMLRLKLKPSQTSPSSTKVKRKQNITKQRAMQGPSGPVDTTQCAKPSSQMWAARRVVPQPVVSLLPACRSSQHLVRRLPASCSTLPRSLGLARSFHSCNGIINLYIKSAVYGSLHPFSYVHMIGMLVLPLEKNLI